MHNRLGRPGGSSKPDEKFLSLLRRALANPVATGEGKLISREAITGDRFGPNGCIRCGDRGALFAFEFQFISLCARCTRDRIDQIVGSGRELPPSVEWLHYEVRTEIQAQDRRARDAFRVKLDVFFRCDWCGKVIHDKVARYWFPPGRNSSPPYCWPCREELASGREPPKIPWKSTFNFDA